MTPTLTFTSIRLPQADTGRLCGFPDLLGNVNLQNRSRFALDEQDAIFEGYGQRYNSYPYPQRIGYGRELQDREIECAVLENDALRAVFLPTRGGRLWQLTDKRAKRELLYTNDVLRYSNLAVCNAWFSGGVEWNVGIIGHSPFTTEPLFTARGRMPSGAPVLRMYEYEQVRGVTFQMDFWLEEQDDSLNCRFRIENSTPHTVPMYWWSNIAVPEWPGGRIAVPAEYAYTQTEGVTCKTAIPLPDGVDVTRYNAIPSSVDYFFRVEESAPPYIAAFSPDGYGLLQTSTSRLQGRKLFSWGHTRASERWQAFLTRDAGPYLEIQAGLGRTQYGCLPMPAHTAWEWLEQYGPLQVDPALLALPHSSFHAAVTSLVRPRTPALEDKLRDTRPMACTEAELLRQGSSAGALEVCRRKAWGDRPLSRHLAFGPCSPALQPWAAWFAGGPAPVPPAEGPLPVCLYGDEAFAYLRKRAAGEDKGNWFIQYQTGVLHYLAGDDERAAACLRRSLRLAPSAYAQYAMACLQLRQGRPVAARHHILAALDLCADPAFLPQAFQVLARAEAWGTLRLRYEALAPEQKQDGRLRLHYIQALGRTGEAARALALLENSPAPCDVREGENTLETLFRELCRRAEGRERPLPAALDFRMQPGATQTVDQAKEEQDAARDPSRSV